MIGGHRIISHNFYWRGREIADRSESDRQRPRDTRRECLNRMSAKNMPPTAAHSLRADGRHRRSAKRQRYIKTKQHAAPPSAPCAKDGAAPCARGSKPRVCTLAGNRLKLPWERVIKVFLKPPFWVLTIRRGNVIISKSLETANKRECAGIGRQARLRGVCCITYGFKSHYSHHIECS